jgi:hypothetical protein
MLLFILQIAGLLLQLTSSSAAATNSETPNHKCNSRILVADRRQVLDASGERLPPPPRMPEDLVWAYTRCGSIPTGDYFVDDTAKGRQTHYKFSSKDMDRFLASAKQMATMPYPSALGKKGWLAQSFRTHNDAINGKHVLVFGSQSPTVESLLLAYGAGKITTVEYNLLSYQHPAITTITPSELEQAAKSVSFERFDTAVSISSFDHDGLGRYGDPLCPDGDLLSNDAVKGLFLKPGGVYFLTVPVGPDVVVWNLHRRYGPVRLPLLLHGWEVVDKVGWEEDMPTRAAPFSQSVEPVFVLRAPQDGDAANMLQKGEDFEDKEMTVGAADREL